MPNLPQIIQRKKRSVHSSNDVLHKRAGQRYILLFSMERPGWRWNKHLHKRKDSRGSIGSGGKDCPPRLPNQPKQPTHTHTKCRWEQSKREMPPMRSLLWNYPRSTATPAKLQQGKRSSKETPIRKSRSSSWKSNR